GLHSCVHPDSNALESIRDLLGNARHPAASFYGSDPAGPLAALWRGGFFWDADGGALGALFGPAFSRAPPDRSGALPGSVSADPPERPPPEGHWFLISGS